MQNTMEYKLPMPRIMTVEDRIADLLHVVTTCLENMLHIPVDQTLFEFAKEWQRVNKKPKSLENFLTNKDTLFLVVLAGITPTDSVFFDPEDYEEDEDAEELNTLFKYNITYTYGDLFVALYVATQKLWELLPGVEDHDQQEMMRAACLLTESCYLLLRPDSLRKIMQVESMDQIAAMTNAWKALLDMIEEANNEDETDELEEGNV